MVKNTTTVHPAAPATAASNGHLPVADLVGIDTLEVSSVVTLNGATAHGAGAAPIAPSVNGNGQAAGQQAVPSAPKPTTEQVLYACSNKKCGHRAPAREMVNLPLEGKGRKALLEGGLIFCRHCSRQGVEMGLVFYELHKTLAFLRKRESKVEASRLEAGAMFQAVKAAQAAKAAGDNGPVGYQRPQGAGADRQTPRQQRRGNGWTVHHG